MHPSEVDAINQMLTHRKNSDFNDRRAEQEEGVDAVSMLKALPIGKNLRDDVLGRDSTRLISNPNQKSFDSSRENEGLGYNSSVQNISNSLNKQSGMRSNQDAAHMTLQESVNFANKTKTNLHSKAGFNFGLKDKHDFKSQPGSELKLN